VVEVLIKDKGAKAISCFATAVSDGHIANVTTGPNIHGATITTTNNGSASDSDFHFVFAVSDFRDPAFQSVARFPVFVAQVNPCLFAIKVNTTTPQFVDGNLTSRDATILKNGAGDVTITLTRGLSLAPVVIATSVGSNTKVSVSSVSNTAIRFKRTSGGSGSDGIVCAFVFASYSSAQPARTRRALKGQRMKPRLLLVNCDETSITFGAEAVPGATSSGGVYGLGDFNPVFKVVPVSVATANGALTSSIHFMSNNFLTLRTHNNGGSLTAGKISALILGWDDASVFTRF
jgi:hypothetical protein